jgi:hypothetical protein
MTHIFTERIFVTGLSLLTFRRILTSLGSIEKFNQNTPISLKSIKFISDKHAKMNINLSNTIEKFSGLPLIHQMLFTAFYTRSRLRIVGQHTSVTSAILEHCLGQRFFLGVVGY